MCGITGIFAFNLVGKFNKIHVTNATMVLEKRGPDFQDIYLDEWIGLGHRRLSIIDTTSVSNQPMWDDTKRYCIIFNGEIFNYRELRTMLEHKGVGFRTTGDTEVLLKLYINDGEGCLSRLNGFFSFCIYDREKQTFFVARDRYGIKPLYYVFDEDKFIFASEMKSIIQYGIERTLDYESLYTYLQLNYIPAPDTIFLNVKKLLPGHYITVQRERMSVHQWYTLPTREETHEIPYSEAKKKLAELLEQSVQRRLISDVPLGAFLSGGIDSSVITALAKRHKSDLHTFSIGFRDEKFFDETHYAKLVADHLKTDHTVFSLTNDDLYAHLNSILDYIDEPFADSSAIAVYILSKETRKHATVALSGDGADEMFAGYNKHAAAFRVLNKGVKENLLDLLGPLWKILPQSRNNFLTNKFRQFRRFNEGSKRSPGDRYWKWAGFATEEDAVRLLADTQKLDMSSYAARKSNLLRDLPQRDESINDILRSDFRLVLANDMLTKVDSMSMANSLEVRVPFLDVDLVNFAFSLPDSFKIDRTIRKKILQDAFRDILPPQLYNRPKKGFEVPLLKWFRGDMKNKILNELLDAEFVRAQGIFSPDVVEKLKNQLFSGNPGDIHARIWALIVFQTWWKKFGRT
jgi:asparagine synthase (glutamine-hydrolysing)